MSESKDSNAPAPGSIFLDKYRVDEMLAKGSLGDDVYSGENIESKDEVFIRILPTSISNDQEFLNRFFREIKFASTLRHKNILTALDAGKSPDGVCYLITEAAKGNFLDEYIKEHGKFPEKKAVEMILNITDAMQYMWKQQKIIHRNIEPSIILVTFGDRAILTDFGLAKSLRHPGALTVAGYTVGRPEYMSPEQIRGETDIDCRADIYALGLVFYYLLAGNHPFQDKPNDEMMEAQLTQEIPSVSLVNPEVSEHISGIISKMLAKNPDDRYQSWQEVITDLKTDPATTKKNVGPVESKPSHQGNPHLESEASETTVKIITVVIIIVIIVLAVASGLAIFLT